MTERDKIIEEMEFVIRPQACNDDICKLYNDNCAKCEATRLYNEGYRKEDEVRKETIKEVIEWFEDHQVCAGCEQMNNEAKKHFGVEVEE